MLMRDGLSELTDSVSCVCWRFLVCQKQTANPRACLSRLYSSRRVRMDLKLAPRQIAHIDGGVYGMTSICCSTAGEQTLPRWTLSLRRSGQTSASLWSSLLPVRGTSSKQKGAQAATPRPSPTSHYVTSAASTPNLQPSSRGCPPSSMAWLSWQNTRVRVVAGGSQMPDPARHLQAPQPCRSLCLAQLSSAGQSPWQSCWMPGCLPAWMRALKLGTLCCCCRS